MSTRSIKSFVQPALQAISYVGLALSLLALIVTAPGLVQVGGGVGIVLDNMAQFAWTLGLLLVVFARTRTVGARTLTGAALAGFFGIASLAVPTGKPFVDDLGPDSLSVMTVFAPLTEELSKLLPVAVLLLLAARSKHRRPSVGDAVLFGVTVASGVALHENILYGRGTEGGWLANLPSRCCSRSSPRMGRFWSEPTWFIPGWHSLREVCVAGCARDHGDRTRHGELPCRSWITRFAAAVGSAIPAAEQIRGKRPDADAAACTVDIHHPDGTAIHVEAGGTTWRSLP